ncbi:unnamed protein product, partial [Oikopleura dioica]
MATEKLIDFVAQDQIYKDYVRKEKDSVGKWVQTFDFMLSEESLKRATGQIETVSARNKNIPPTSALKIGHRVGKKLDPWAGERAGRGPHPLVPYLTRRLIPNDMRTCFTVFQFIFFNSEISRNSASASFSGISGLRRYHQKRSSFGFIERRDEGIKCIGEHKFILKRQICDGRPDCRDGSDEITCTSIKWTSIHLPESCKSSSDCDYKFQYQYDQNQGKCEKCLDCGPCSTIARFWTMEDCQNDCEFPDRMRIFQQETFSVLYSEVYPGLYPFKRNLVELWLSGNIRQPEMKAKKNNFALRGVILEAERNPTDADQFSVIMTINEDYNQQWISGYSARLNVTLRKRKHFPLGKEMIITGKTSGNLDNNDRLKVTDAVLRS